MSTLGIVLLIAALVAYVVSELTDKPSPILVLLVLVCGIAGFICVIIALCTTPVIYVTPSGTFVSSDTLMQVRGDYIENLNNY